jgi:hypothetical protein
MIPSIDPSVIELNPQFASLHKHVATNLLNPDASTRATIEPHALVSDALHLHLLRAAKEELLRSSLRNVATESKRKADSDALEWPPEFRELVGTISMVLDEAPNTTLDAEDYDLLAPEIDAFHNNIGIVAGALSKDLQKQHDVLCKIAGAAAASAAAAPLQATTKRSTHSRTTPSSSSSSGSLQTLLQPILPTIPDNLLQASVQNLANTTRQHAHIHRTLLTTTFTHLERTTYGLHARHAKARSAHLRAVATALEGRIKVQYLQCRNKLYRTDVQSALGNYQRHLKDVETGLEERKAVLRGLVDEYDAVEPSDGGGVVNAGQGQNGLMREVGRRYGEVLRDIELVKQEIEKLERGEQARERERVKSRTGGEEGGKR